MEPIELPCNNCIVLPRCISRLQEEYDINDLSEILPYDVVIDSCSILSEYLPYEYVYDSSDFCPDDIAIPRNVSMSEEEWLRRCNAIMDKFDQYFQPEV